MTADHKFDLGEIKNRSARQRLKQALEYKQRIDNLMNRLPESVSLTLDDYTDKFDLLIDRMFYLSKGFDELVNSPVFKPHRLVIQLEIEMLKRRVANEPNPRIKAGLQSALDAKQELLQYLQAIKDHIATVDRNINEILEQLRRFYRIIWSLDRKIRRVKR